MQSNSKLIDTQKQSIAVLGGATRFTNDQLIAAYQVGREIGRQNKNLITGATNGVPYAAAIGAKNEGALVVGISPAASFEEHCERYKKPIDMVDIIIYTGAGVAGRSSILIQSVIGGVFIGGEMGTLNEFTAAWMQGNNVLGILQDAEGITGHLETIVGRVETAWGSRIIYDEDPSLLARSVCQHVDELVMSRVANQFESRTGKDVQAVIYDYLKMEGEESCGLRQKTIPFGVRSTISLP